MTVDLAERVMGRQAQNLQRLSDAKRTEILMDWLEGTPYKDIQAKYGVPKSAVASVVMKARREAKAVLAKSVRKAA